MFDAQLYDVQCMWKVQINVGRSSIAVRMLGSQSRVARFESSCCCFVALAILFIPHCHSSLSCINEYLAIDRDGYRNE